MSAPEDLQTLVAVNPKEGEEGDFDLANIQLKITEMDLVKLHCNFPIPPAFQLEVPREQDRAYKMPSGRLCLYKESFKAGMRLPLHPFFIAFLRFFSVSPCTLSPLSKFMAIHRLVYHGLFSCWGHPSISLFRFFYTFKHPKPAVWWYASPEKGIHRLILWTPSTIHHWKE